MSFTDLPYISTRPDGYIKEKSSPPSGRERGDCIKKEGGLRNWEEWMRRRKEVHEKLAKRTKRKPEELLMNTGDRERNEIENKLLMEYSRLPGKYYRRGEPGFWKIPPHLRKIGCEPQTYFTQLTKTDKEQLPDMEYVGVPPLIRREKQAICQRRFFNLEYSPYFQHKLKNDVNFDVHKPQIDDLIVLGGPLIEREETRCLNVIEEESKTTSDDVAEELPKPVLILELNDVNIFNSDTGVKGLTLYMESVKSQRVAWKYLLIKNRTKYALRFYFKKLQEARKQKQIFFYNLNTKIILPNQKFNFPFWFQSGTPGPCLEYLELVVTPNFWNDELTIKITLKAQEPPNNLLEKCNGIFERIQNNARSSLINDVLGEMINRAVIPVGGLQIFTYDKAMLFESVNSIYDPLHFRPRYLYDKKIVDELEIFYENVRLDIHPEVWDYKLDTLRVFTKDRERYDAIEKLEDTLGVILEKIGIAKLKREELQAKALSFWKQEKVNLKKEPPPKKPKGKEEKKKKEKKDEVSGKGKKGVQKTIRILERERPPLLQTLSDHLEAIIAKLEKPVTIKIASAERLRIAYNLLCAYVDRMTEEIEGAREELNIIQNPPSITSLVWKAERHFNEKLETCSLQSPKFSKSIKASGQSAAPSWTSDIPLEIYEERFKCYQNLYGVKGKKVKEAPKPKKGKSVDDSIPRHTVTSGGSNIKESESSEDTQEPEPIVISKEQAEAYREQLYLIIYMNIRGFIEDMVSVFELQPPQQIESSALLKINAKQFEPKRSTTGFKITLIDLKNKISQVLDGKEEVAEVRRKTQSVTPHIPVAEKTSSVWSLLATYYPKPVPLKPQESGDVYAVPFKRGVSRVDMETSVSSEEVILERGVQTSICSGGPVEFETRETLEGDVKKCVCPEQPEAYEEPTFLYYSSKLSLDAISEASTDELDPCNK